MKFSKIKKILTTDFGQFSKERQRQRNKEEEQKKLNEIYMKAMQANRLNKTSQNSSLEGIHVYTNSCSPLEKDPKLLNLVLHTWVSKKDIPQLLQNVILGEIKDVSLTSYIMEDLQLLKDIAVNHFNIEDPHSPLNTIQLETKQFNKMQSDL